VRGVTDQRKIQFVLVAEIPQLFHRVSAHPHYVRLEFFQFFFGVPELVRLAGSTWSIRLGEEVQHQLFASKVS
jgi:hypothetical protein